MTDTYAFAEVVHNGRPYTITANPASGVGILFMAGDVTKQLSDSEIRAIYELGIRDVVAAHVQEEDEKQRAADIMQQEYQESQRRLAEAAARDHQRMMGEGGY